MSYIEFRLLGKPLPEVKTEVWSVMSMRGNALLGLIKWYGPWRQYAFFPAPGTVWNVDCLTEVQEKIATLKRQRRNVRVNSGLKP